MHISRRTKPAQEKYGWLTYSPNMTIAVYRRSKTIKQHNRSHCNYNLLTVSSVFSSISGVANYIHKSPLGILLPRKGGKDIFITRERDVGTIRQSIVGSKTILKI